MANEVVTVLRKCAGCRQRTSLSGVAPDKATDWRCPKCGRANSNFAPNVRKRVWIAVVVVVVVLIGAIAGGGNGSDGSSGSSNGGATATTTGLQGADSVMAALCQDARQGMDAQQAMQQVSSDPALSDAVSGMTQDEFANLWEGGDTQWLCG